MKSAQAPVASGEGASRAAGVATSPPASERYRPAIDGLRAVAVLSVFVFHLKNNWLRGGFVGVDVFFVISGFLITSILLHDYEQKRFSLGKFYQRRIARLFPAFFVVAAATQVGAYFIYSAQDLASCGANLTAATLSVANLKYMIQGSYFTISPDAQPFLHYWSLSVEEQFYMLFPSCLFLICLVARKWKKTILAVLCGASFLVCIALTHARPTWAFYLLPTRAWELLAGSLLASYCEHPTPSKYPKVWNSLALAGLAVIGVSFFVIHEGMAFPGYIAALPVLGTVCFLGPNNGSNGFAERLLAWSPMALIGRMSYSLYLWHWPVFSLIDYRFYTAAPLIRISAKVAISFAAAALSFFLIEKPSRVFLNDRSRRRFAFAFLGCALAIFSPLGVAIRNANYVNASVSDILKGGLAFNESGKNGSIMLMGDSNGSMYGKMTRELAKQLDLKLNVLSVAAEDPLPHSSGPGSQFWLDSLAAVKRENPDFLILVCNWNMKLNGDEGRLAVAVNELKQHVRCLILLTQPPMLPESATRAAMRNGSRPPYFEDPAERAGRLRANAIVKSLNSDGVVAIDIEDNFSTKDGELLFADRDGHQLYEDTDHLSEYGADLVMAQILPVIQKKLEK